jgi:hypothetical protein
LFLEVLQAVRHVSDHARQRTKEKRTYIQTSSS